MGFRITATSSKAHLLADQRLQPADFRAIEVELDQTAVRARKIGYVAARQAQHQEVVVTYWNGQETNNIAEPGDWIVASLSPEREVLRDRDGQINTYVIAADRFPDLYEAAEGHQEHGAIFRAKGVVEALPLPGGFDIVAPWGERQQAAAGYLILNGKDVYGNNAETFEATYGPVASL